MNGKPTAKPLPDGDHVTIFMWLLRQCMRHRPDLDLHPEQGLKFGAYRNGRARPDGSLGPVGHFAGLGEWADPSGVLMAVEVTSHDSGTDRRDRVEKRDGYAQADIPVYLLIDRDTNALVVHSAPQHGTYTQTDSHPYGATVQLPPRWTSPWKPRSSRTTRCSPGSHSLTPGPSHRAWPRPRPRYPLGYVAQPYFFAWRGTSTTPGLLWTAVKRGPRTGTTHSKSCSSRTSHLDGPSEYRSTG
ncbi:Uma2 family endonuclease [Streptomyces violascens]|uniref:Uma2 family endonuclease n=1 Tax=Streptomyces violascens TaxID=67381 RepID=UPI0036BCC502